MKRTYFFLTFVFAVACLSGCTSGNEGDGESVVVLMYHHFDENEANTSSVTMTPERFKEQLLALKEAGYTSIRERDLYDYYYNGGTLPEKPVVIRIDDGYRSNYEYAYPILKELEWFATIYVVTDFRGETPGKNPHFTWDEAREMVASGWIDIQSHTANAHHYVQGKRKEGPFLTTKQWDGKNEESDADYRARIRDDLLRAKETIEREIGNDVYALTFPYGAFNDVVIDVAREVGYELMYTVRKGVNDEETSPFKLNRINADGAFSGADLLKEIAKYK